MQFSQLRTLVRAYIPAAKAGTITDDTINLMLNAGAGDIAAKTGCYKKNKKFASVASQSEYTISTVASDFLRIDASGIWWYNSTQYKRLDPKTKAWLDDNSCNWRDRAASTPQYYYIDSDTIGIFPKPVSTVTDAFWIYYCAKPTDMTAEGDYPFTGAVHSVQFDVFDEAILKYCKWKIDPMYSKDQQTDVTEAAYDREIASSMAMFNRRTDISHSPYTLLQGQKMRRSY